MMRFERLVPQSGIFRASSQLAAGVESAFLVTMRGLLKVLELVVTAAKYLFQNGLNPK